MTEVARARRVPQLQHEPSRLVLVAPLLQTVLVVPEKWGRRLVDVVNLEARAMLLPPLRDRTADRAATKLAKERRKALEDEI